MTKLFKTSAVLTAVLLATTAAHADFNANIEFDNTWQNNNRGVSQGGRVELNAVSKLSPNYFIAGKASFLAKKDGSSATDDLWVQFGSAAADIKLGRFEAANIFPLERDTLVPFAGFTAYQGNILRGRGFVRTGAPSLGVPQAPNGGDSAFHAAGTFNAGGGLSFELGVVESKDPTVNKGVRPVVSYVAGPLSLSAGIESVKYASNQKRETGFSGTVGYSFGDYKLNANLASIKDDIGFKTNSYGLVLSSAGLGGGLVYGEHGTAAGKAKVTTGYVTYAMPLFDIKGATITPALAISRAGGANTAPTDKGVRVRINYAF